MVEIKPFKGIIYNQKRVKLEKVVSPPYDVISEEERQQLAKRSPYNIVHLILGKGKNWPEEAGKRFEQWLKEEIFVLELDEAIYFYTMEYDLKGEKRTQQGFIARVKIEPFEKKIILPHEKTFTKVVAERLRLLKATKANLSQIYGIYDDKEDKIISILSKVVQDISPFIKIKFDNVTHCLFRVTDKNVFKILQDLMYEKKIVIADGHHRYRTALAYKEEMQKKFPDIDAPFNYVCMYLSSFRQITILPIHRLIPTEVLLDFSLKNFFKKLEQYFELKVYKKEKIFWKKLRENKIKTVIGLYIQDIPDNFFLLKLKKQDWTRSLSETLKKIDTIVLNQLILKKMFKFSETQLNQEDFIYYISDDQMAISLVREGKYKMAFLLNPLSPENLKDVVLASCLLPRKSTYFYPKILTGLVINSLRI
ncbi:MAG: DUF1015 domain-containing protein [Candidatus Desulfofervidus auxilii]|nr:DUF1015 domain-containing protein [Candidatus Desulfofervidus auxilii]